MRIISLMLLMSLPIWAEDWTTTDGKTYQNVKVIKVEPDAVTIIDSDGGGVVSLAKLCPALQKRFAYDPAKAKIAMAQRAQIEQASIQAEIKEREFLNDRQTQQNIAAQVDDQDAQKHRIEQATQLAKQAELQKHAKQLSVVVLQILPNGILAQQSQLVSTGYGIGDGTPSYQAAYVDSGGPIFIEMAPQGIAESQRLKPWAAQNGTYTYTDTDGASRTVEKWTAIP